jgi:large subunit ribosomal protein L10|tara:strand:- start:90 stop:641 length:552 start_codon:yes stop_codon:yes gene_type:complete
MVRKEKVDRVKEIEALFSEASALVLAEYRGLTVSQQMQLRRSLTKAGASFNVIKMSLARRAAENIGFDNIVDFLKGPTGVTVIEEDPVEAAKVLKNFSDDYEFFVVKGGRMGDEEITVDKFETLATIDSKEVLLAKIAGGLNAPLNKLFGLGKALINKPSYAFRALVEKKNLDNQSETNKEEE